MAHFAQLDENNVVTQVIVVSNNELLDANGQEREELGVAFCQRLFGGNWKQTSYNNSMRVRYAGIGYSYNATLDAYVPPKPFPSDHGTGDPIKHYYWNEEAQDWQLPA